MANENEYISIDEMLGRSSSSAKQQDLGKGTTKKIPDNILKEAKNIGKSVSGTITAVEQKPVTSYAITKKPSIAPTRGR